MATLIVELQSAFYGEITILQFYFISFLYLLYLLSLHYESSLKTTLWNFPIYLLCQHLSFNWYDQSTYT